MSKYAELPEEQKKILRERSRNWRANNPEKAKTHKKNAVLKKFQPSVYAYFNLNGECLYVGKSNYLHTRIWHHSKTSTWWNSSLLLVSITCKDEWEAMEYEGKWGGNYRPLNNIDGQRKQKYGYYKGVE